MNKKIAQLINLKVLLFLHGLITLAAGIALLIDPNLIPEVVGIHLSPSAFLVPYLLGTAELCIAALSFAASKFTDAFALRSVVWSFIVLHGSTALVEIYAFSQGLSVLILGNVALRVVVVALFAYIGLYTTHTSNHRKKQSI